MSNPNYVAPFFPIIDRGADGTLYCADSGIALRTFVAIEMMKSMITMTQSTYEIDAVQACAAADALLAELAK